MSARHSIDDLVPQGLLDSSDDENFDTPFDAEGHSFDEQVANSYLVGFGTTGNSYFTMSPTSRFEGLNLRSSEESITRSHSRSCNVIADVLAGFAVEKLQAVVHRWQLGCRPVQPPVLDWLVNPPEPQLQQSPMSEVQPEFHSAEKLPELSPSVDRWNTSPCCPMPGSCPMLLCLSIRLPLHMAAVCLLRSTPF